ncbi:MAG: pilin [Parcubacteria group bacterium]
MFRHFYKLAGMFLGLLLLIPIRVFGAAGFFGESSDVTQYVKTFYIFGSSIVGAVAVGALVLAGVNYMRSSGNEEHVTKSKEMFAGALIGLVLVMGSYVILRTLDPRLVTLKIDVPDMQQATSEADDKWGDSAKKCSSAGECKGFDLHIYECSVVGKDPVRKELVKTQCVKGYCYVKEGAACGIASYGSSFQNDNVIAACDKEKGYGGISFPQKCPPGTKCKDAGKKAMDVFGFTILNLQDRLANFGGVKISTCEKI